MSNYNEDEVNGMMNEWVFTDDLTTEEETTAPEELFVQTASSQAMNKVEPNTVLKKYSEVMGWNKDVLKNRKDFNMVIYEDAYWDDEDKVHIPSMDEFKNRIVDHSVMYDYAFNMQPTFAGDKMLVVGPTGSGKTTLTRFYAAKVNQPLLELNGRGDMESDSIIGRTWVDGDKMDFLLGLWPRATKKGWIASINEGWKIPPSIMMTAQRHLEAGGIWLIDEIPSDNIEDKQIVPKSSYRCVFSDNVVGTGDGADKYSATMIQDGSSLNRFSIILNVPYLPPKLETKLVTDKFPMIPEAQATKMINMLNLLRGGYDAGELSAATSTRQILDWAERAVKYEDYEHTFLLTILNRFAEDEERDIVTNHYYTCFAKNL